MLDNVEYLLIAGGVLLAVALVCNAIVVTRASKATERNTAATGSKKLVAVGASSGSATADGPEASDADTVRTGTRKLSADEAAAPAEPRTHGAAWYGTAFVVVALVLFVVYLVMRTIETGYGPFTNQHEFAVSFLTGIVGAYLVFERLYGVRSLSLIVLPVALALLLYALTLDTGPRPVMPALQNNMLLTLHVGSAMIAYGAACVSFAGAALYLLRPRIKWKAMPSREMLDEIAYRAAVVTFPLLTLMIVLGAIWADTAWGRYWGWDPKETAALVSWLVYGANLHARVVRGWRGNKAAWLLIVGFGTILFAYFGNHFFGGLHSYA